MKRALGRLKKRYAYWLAVILGLLFLAFAIYIFLIKSPADRHVVIVSDQKVVLSPENIDAWMDGPNNLPQRLKREMAIKPASMPAGPDLFEEFKFKLSDQTPTASAISETPHYVWPGPSPQVGCRFLPPPPFRELPACPKPARPNVTFGRSMILQPDTNGALLDVSWIKISTQLDIAALSKDMYDKRYDVRFDGGFNFTKILAVNFYFQEQLPDGTWGPEPAALLPSQRIVPLPPFPTEDETAQLEYVDRIMQPAREGASETYQELLAHPPFYVLAKDARGRSIGDDAMKIDARAASSVLRDALVANPPIDLAKPIVPKENSLPLNIWGFDDKLGPGRTYRYQVEIVIFNPLFHTKGVAGEELTKEFAITSPRSDWSEPVAVPAADYFFLTGAVIHDAANPKCAESEIQATCFHWSAGRWHHHTFDHLHVGDAIGGFCKMSEASGESIGVDFSTGCTIAEILPGYASDDARLVATDSAGSNIIRRLMEDAKDPTYKSLLNGMFPVPNPR